MKLWEFFAILYFSLIPFVVTSQEAISISRNTYVNDNKDLHEIEIKGLGQDEIDLLIQSKDAKKRESDIQRLKEAKVFILNGNLDRASYNLSKIDDSSSALKIIKRRYLSLIHFLNNDYAKAINLLDDEFSNNDSYYRQICNLKELSLLALRKKKELQKENIQCSFATLKSLRNDGFWFDGILKILNNDFSLFTKASIQSNRYLTSSDEFTRTWFKLALFANKESIIAENIAMLPAESYRSKRTREVLGFIFYRMGDFKRAFDFIEDISSVNAENLKGNILLKEGKDELALGHFKLALQKKEDSLNALERAIPLSWKLKSWEDGLHLINKYVFNTDSFFTIKALKAAFLMKTKQHLEAQKLIDELNTIFTNSKPVKVLQMDSILAMETGQPKKFLDKAGEACAKNDGLSCWMLLQSYIWPDFINLSKKQNQKILNDPMYTLSALKEKVTITGITESIVVDQKDIEELDNLNLSKMQQESF